MKHAYFTKVHAVSEGVKGEMRFGDGNEDVAAFVEKEGAGFAVDREKKGWRSV